MFRWLVKKSFLVLDQYDRLTDIMVALDCNEKKSKEEPNYSYHWRYEQVLNFREYGAPNGEEQVIL